MKTDLGEAAAPTQHVMEIYALGHNTSSDNKVMRLVPKIVSFYLFTNYNVVTFKVLPLCLHTTFPTVLPLFIAFLERHLWDVV